MTSRKTPHLSAVKLVGRAHIGSYLNQQRLLGVAVEVGTHRGEFAEQFMAHWRGRRLFCVDPWSVPAGYEEQAKLLPEARGVIRDRNEDLERAKSVLARFGDRVTLLQALSLEAVINFADKSLDFVYIDGDHSAEAVRADLAAWWPKVVSRGILAGHDFICPVIGSNYDWGLGIQPPVFEFAEQHGLVIYVVPETTGGPWSFFFVKP